MSTKVAVTGINGQVGRAFSAVMPDNWDLAGSSSATVDVRQWEQVRDWIASVRPNLVVHAAAMTNVDGCESNIDDAFAVNALGSRHVASAAERVGAVLVYISTNFVFSGEQERPYHEFDKPRPISVYGASKLAGEREARAANRHCYVVRTAMVYDKIGNNFVNTMRSLMAERDQLSVVDDQFGNPTYAPDLAASLIGLLADRPPGTYHLTNSGSTSWFGWAREIQRIEGFDCEIRAIDAAEFKRAATPPRNGTLSSIAWPDGASAMPEWHDALRRCLRA